MFYHLPLILTCCVLFCSIHAQETDEELINRGIEKVFDDHFEEAREYIQSGSKKNAPLSDFLMHWIMYEENDVDNMKSFEKKLEKRINALKETSKMAASESQFLQGMWNGLMALYLVREDRMLSAYKYGRRAFEILRECLLFNPKKYDAYYGLGLYHKMKYELGGSLWFIPQSSEDGKIARKYFRLAVRKGNFTRELSKYALIEMSF
jgi:tetratricopeptide (TPR) repeat protein